MVRFQGVFGASGLGALGARALLSRPTYDVPFRARPTDVVRNRHGGVAMSRGGACKVSMFSTQLKTPARRVGPGRGPFRTDLSSAAVFSVLAATASLISLLLTVASASAQDDAAAVELDTLAVSCPDAGRVDYTVLNLGPDDTAALVEFGPVQRFVDVPANGVVTDAITGRLDGIYDFSIDGTVIEQVQVRCADDYVFNDQVTKPVTFSFFGIAGSRSFIHNRRDQAVSLDSGEVAECHEDQGGTVWYQGLAPGSSLQFDGPSSVRIGVFEAGPGSPETPEDLDFLTCLDEETPRYDVMPGTRVWLQVSGLSGDEWKLAAANVPTIDLNLEPTCANGVGFLTATAINRTDEEVRAEVVLRNQSFVRIARTLTLRPGESKSVNVSGRTDGYYRADANEGFSDTETWVECVANTGINDTVANALRLEANEWGVANSQAAIGTFGHTLDELTLDGCIGPSLGSAWYSIVATGERLVFDGSDDQIVALFASSIPNPQSLADLDLLTCGEPEDLPSAAVELGETYWIAVSDDLRQSWQIVNAEPAGNTTISDARRLRTFDDVPGALPDVSTADARPCGNANDGALWWKWTALSSGAELNVVGSVGDTFRPLYTGGVAMYTSTVSDPVEIDDLDFQGCLRNFGDLAFTAQAGQTYWVQVPVAPYSTVTIGAVDTTVDLGVTTSCLRGRGRIDVELENDSLYDVASQVAIVGRNPASGNEISLLRQRELLSGEEGTVSVTGRSDGVYFVHLRSGAVTASTTVEVRCSPSQGAVTVQVSCLGGNGRVDIDVRDPTGAIWAVQVSTERATIDRRAYVLFSDRFTITGRPDGEYKVTVWRSPDEPGEEVVLAAERTVSC